MIFKTIFAKMVMEHEEMVWECLIDRILPRLGWKPQARCKDKDSNAKIEKDLKDLDLDGRLL